LATVNDYSPIIATLVTCLACGLLAYLTLSVWPRMMRRLRRAIRRLKGKLRRVPRAVGTPIAVSIGIVSVGVVLGLVAGLDGGAISRTPVIHRDFFSTTAQIFPVFLIAFAVGQRFAQNTAQRYADDADHALSAAVHAQIAFEDMEEDGANALAATIGPDLGWVWEYVDDVYRGNPDQQPDIRRIARRRFALRRRGEAGVIVAVIILILCGEAASIVGLTIKDTGSSGGVASTGGTFGITLACLCATIVVITLASLRDIVQATRV
jgi:hypothetical protein